jgi:hypothetical protein
MTVTKPVNVAATLLNGIPIPPKTGIDGFGDVRFCLDLCKQIEVFFYQIPVRLDSRWEINLVKSFFSSNRVGDEAWGERLIRKLSILDLYYNTVHM